MVEGSIPSEFIRRIGPNRQVWQPLKADIIGAVQKRQAKGLTSADIDAQVSKRKSSQSGSDV